MNSVCYNFLVCKAYHYTRTVPLYDCIVSKINSTNSKAYLIGGFDQFDNIEITKVCNVDDYLSCIIKTYKVFEIHDGIAHDWYFIGDDDTFIDLVNLNKLIKNLSIDALQIHGFICGCREFPSSFKHAHGGSGILMNQKTFLILKEFIKRNTNIMHNLHSDISLALCVDKYNNTSTNKIEWNNIQGMYGPDIEIDKIDKNAAITIHTKDRESFYNLISNKKGKLML